MNSSVSFDNSNNAPYNYDYHTIRVQLLNHNISTGSITTYETPKACYNESIDL